MDKFAKLTIRLFRAFWEHAQFIAMFESVFRREETEVNQMIIHVDMDAFYASVETRDNPFLYGKPLIIGARPTERGVVATCSYEAWKFGVRSGMNIKDAYRLCPNGVYF